MTFYALWSEYGVRKWSTVFERWGFSTFSEELYGEDHVRWVNFGDTADVDDIPRFYAGTVDKNRSEFVVPTPEYPESFIYKKVDAVI